MKPSRMRCAGHAARIIAKRNTYRTLVGNPERKILLGRPRSSWVDNIKMELKEISWEVMDWIYVA
jgi:hypothetical protein